MTQQSVLLDVRTSPTAGPSRLQLKPKSPTSGYVDGAWWPRGTDLAAELPDLLTELAIQLGLINRVLYRLGEWTVNDRKVVINDHVIRLDGYRLQPPTTVEVQGADRGRIVLLVIPPSTDPDDAHRIMKTASTQGNNDTIDHLLATTDYPRVLSTGVQPRLACTSRDGVLRYGWAAGIEWSARSRHPEVRSIRAVRTSSPQVRELACA